MVPCRSGRACISHWTRLLEAKDPPCPSPCPAPGSGRPGQVFRARPRTSRQRTNRRAQEPTRCNTDDPPRTDTSGEWPSGTRTHTYTRSLHSRAKGRSRPGKAREAALGPRTRGRRRGVEHTWQLLPFPGRLGQSSSAEDYGVTRGSWSECPQGSHDSPPVGRGQVPTIRAARGRTRGKALIVRLPGITSPFACTLLSRWGKVWTLC